MKTVNSEKTRNKFQPEYIGKGNKNAVKRNLPRREKVFSNVFMALINFNFLKKIK